MAKRRIQKQSHATAAALALTDLATDAQVLEDTIEEMEHNHIADRHIAAGENVPDGRVPHDFREHCALCCDFDSCEERN